MKVQSRSDDKKIGELVCDGAMKFVQNFAVEINGERVAQYDGLDAVAKDWKDYKPAEPLIKDEKVRKAVRAWAEANNVTKVWHEGSSVGFCDGAVSIKFHELCWEEIPKGEYAIAELCGEEEE